MVYKKNIVTYYWQPCVLLIFRYPSLLGGQIIFQAESSTQHSTVLRAQCTFSHHLLVVILDLPRRHPCTCHHRHDDRAYHDDSEYSGELTTASCALHESNWYMDVRLSHIRVRVAIGVCSHSCVFEKGDTPKPTTRYHKVLSRTRRRNRHRPGNGNNPIVCFKVPYLCELLYVSYKRHAILFCTCQSFKLIFWDCYNNLAFCDMNSIKQFINFRNVVVNPLRFSGHKGQAWVQPNTSMFTKPNN